MSGTSPSLNISAGQPITVNAQSGAATAPVSNDVSIRLVTSGLTISGWMDLAISCGIETCPNNFEISLTEAFPGQATQISVMPGDAIQVLIGTDVVITGYVDAYTASVSPRGHTIKIAGRGACQDIVDSSAVVAAMQLTGSSLVQLATSLTVPFGVKVTAPDGDGTQFFLTAVNLGETPYEIIERVARYEGFLVYEAADGSLVLARPGTNTHSSGLVLGQNLQAATVALSMNGRFSQYIPALFAAQSYLDIGAAGNYAGATVYDKGVSGLTRLDGQPRYRPHFVISEQYVNGQFTAQLRAQWECNRRWGRSQVARVTVDTWRDSAGKLWTPNWEAPISLPQIKVGNVSWLIASVRFRRGLDSGTTADIELMPTEAFTVEPLPIQQYDFQIYQATHPDAPTPGSTGGAGGPAAGGSGGGAPQP